MNNYANGLTDWEEQKILADQAVVRAEKALADIKGTYEGNYDGFMTAETKEKLQNSWKLNWLWWNKNFLQTVSIRRNHEEGSDLIENGTTLPETPAEETPAE